MPTLRLLAHDRAHRRVGLLDLRDQLTIGLLGLVELAPRLEGQRDSGPFGAEQVAVVHAGRVGDDGQELRRIVDRRRRVLTCRDLRADDLDVAEIEGLRERRDQVVARHQRQRNQAGVEQRLHAVVERRLLAEARQFVGRRLELLGRVGEEAGPGVLERLLERPADALVRDDLLDLPGRSREVLGRLHRLVGRVDLELIRCAQELVARLVVSDGRVGLRVALERLPLAVRGQHHVGARGRRDGHRADEQGAQQQNTATVEHGESYPGRTRDRTGRACRRRNPEPTGAVPGGQSAPAAPSRGRTDAYDGGSCAAARPGTAADGRGRGGGRRWHGGRGRDPVGVPDALAGGDPRDLVARKAHRREALRAAATHRDQLGDDRDRDLAVRRAAEVESDRRVEAGEIDSVEPAGVAQAREDAAHLDLAPDQPDVSRLRVERVVEALEVHRVATRHDDGVRPRGHDEFAEDLPRSSCRRSGGAPRGSGPRSETPRDRRRPRRGSRRRRPSRRPIGSRGRRRTAAGAAP